MITRPLEPGTWGLGWCQFWSPAEFPRVPNRKAYEADPGEPPDWRITCFSPGAARAAAAWPQRPWPARWSRVAALGGGVVEGYPEDVAGRKVSGSFLSHGTLAMFESQGFERVRKISKHRWVVAKAVGP